MTRLTKTIKADIKSIIREKAIKPKELALEVKKQEFLLKTFWSQLSKYEYQAWKTLPSAMYKTVTQTTYHIQVSDKALGSIFHAWYSTLEICPQRALTKNSRFFASKANSLGLIALSRIRPLMSVLMALVKRVMVFP